MLAPIMVLVRWASALSLASLILLVAAVLKAQLEHSGSVDLRWSGMFLGAGVISLSMILVWTFKADPGAVSGAVAGPAPSKRAERSRDARWRRPGERD